jgi:hypothetical protein
MRRFSPPLALAVAAAAMFPPMAAAQTTSGREQPFMPLRFMEDVRRYCPDAADEVDEFTIKCLRPFGPDDAVISIGGEVKWKVESSDNPAFGFGGDAVTYPLQRILVHADARLFPHVRAFVQLGHHVRYGGDRLARPTDDSGVDVQQAFIDIYRRPGHDDGWALRLGRQELGLGSTRFVGAREGANVRLAFDAALFSWQSPNRYRVEAFVGRPVENRRGTFDNRGDPSRAFWGLYTTTRLWGQASFPERATDQAISLDLYYYGYENERGPFADGNGAERRHAFGARLFGRHGALDLDWEAQVQLGSLGGADIRAWTFASDSGWTLRSAPGAPRLGLRADIASGDGRRGDGVIGSLQPLFASPAYFSEAALVAPVNLVTLNPYVTVTPGSDLKLQLGWNLLWKHRRADAFYRPGPFAVPGTEGGARRVGNQLWAGATWTLNRNLSLTGSLVRFNAGPAIRQGGGRDVDYGTISVKVQF